MINRSTANAAVARLLIAQDSVQGSIDRINNDIEYHKNEVLKLMRDRDFKIAEQEDLVEAVDKLVAEPKAEETISESVEPMFAPILEFPNAPVMAFTVLPFDSDEDTPSLEDVVQFLIASGIGNKGGF